MLWLIGMGLEVREIYKILTMVGKYPDSEQFGDEAVIEEADPADPEDVRYRIQGIESSHRKAVGILIVIRLFFTLVLAYVGVVFLLKQIDYIDLLLDGVALLYIVQIADSLYSQLLREEVRDQTEDIKPMRVLMYGFDYLNRRPALVDMISLAVILTIVIVLMERQLRDIVIPVYDALECTCLKIGEKCIEAKKFDYDFWYKYWKITVPGIFDDVKALKANPTSHAVSFAGAASSAATYVAGHAIARATRKKIPSAAHQHKHRSMKQKHSKEQKQHVFSSTLAQ